MPKSVKVTPELTRKTAALARLELSDDEVKRFTSQLGRILGYVEQISGVEGKEVAPMTHPLELELTLREDEVREFASDGRPGFLDGAPELTEDGYRVPSIL